ncbi:YdeI/OmpD-associated family protein [Novipirellula caenicola]|uniref:DUF1905 domain-containing protein n=1 Tax=Novipirellula caenicola TaxID=1536901 RepID=A0ABP9VJY2_9BACT
MTPRKPTNSSDEGMTNTSPVGKTYSFEATLENWAEGMDYCAAPVPTEITKALGTKAAVLVMARVNDSQPFKVSLFPVGGGKHYIRIKASVRRETKTKTGDRIQLRIKVLDRDDVEIPDDLMMAMHADGVEEAFMSLSPGKRNYIVRRIEDAVKPETRDKRIQEALAAAKKQR